MKCNYCKLYKKHIREADLQDRFQKKFDKISKTIEIEKDTYWNRFIKLKEILAEYGYIEGDYPTEKGVMTAAFRAENELYLAELLFNGVFDDLNYSELAAVVCAITTEEDRVFARPRLKLSKNVKNAVFKARDVLKKIHQSQKDKGIDIFMNWNPKFSAYLEFWINGGEWNDMFVGDEFSEGDVVRAFKRTIDVLRQFCTIKDIPDEIAKNASLAIDCINRDPIKED